MLSDTHTTSFLPGADMEPSSSVLNSNFLPVSLPRPWYFSVLSLSTSLCPRHPLFHSPLLHCPHFLNYSWLSPCCNISSEIFLVVPRKSVATSPPRPFPVGSCRILFQYVLPSIVVLITVILRKEILLSEYHIRSYK